jgi:hypothetical protein
MCRSLIDVLAHALDLRKKGNGLFVSLEKLFPYHPQDTSAAQPSSHHSMPTVEGVGQQGHTQPHSNSRHRQDNVIEVTNVSAAPATLEVGSSIELVGNPSLHGVIMWMGTLPGVRGTIAGVELVGSVVLCFVYNKLFSRLRMVQWRGVGMESGKVVITLPVSPGEPTSVPSPLSGLTLTHPIPDSKLHPQKIVSLDIAAMISLLCLSFYKGGGGLSNMLVFTPHMLHRAVPANILGAMQDHESMHRQWCSKIGRTYANLTVVPAKKAEPDYVNITEPQGLGNLQTAHYEVSNSPTTMASSSPENGSSVDLYGSDQNLPTTPTNSIQSLQLGLDQDISPTTHRHTGLSSENGSSVDLYGSPHSPASPTNGIESVQPFLDTNNPPVNVNRQMSSFSFENGSSVDLYGSPPSPLTPKNSLWSLQPFRDQNNPPVNTGRQRRFSSENSSSVDLYGCGSGPNSPISPIKDHPSLPTVDQDEGEEEDIYSSGRLLPTQEELSSQAKATVSTDGHKFQPQQQQQPQPTERETCSNEPLVRDICSPGGRGKMEHTWTCQYCTQLNVSTVNPDTLP